MEIKGKVIEVLPLKEGTSMMGKPWQVQAFIIETQEQFPKKVCIEIFGQEKIDKFLPVLRIGGAINASFDIESRQFNSKWFTSVRAWKIEPTEEEVGTTDEPMF